MESELKSAHAAAIPPHEPGSRAMLWALSAAVGAAVIGVLFYNVMPLYLGAMQDSLGFSASDIGFVASAFFFGFNLSSASAFFWVRTVRMRRMVVACVVAMAILFALAAFISDYRSMLVISVLIGAASGAVASAAATLIGESRNSARWFGVKVAAESLAGVILLFALPMALIPSLGFRGMVAGMLLVIVVIAPFLFLLEKGPIAAGAVGGPPGKDADAVSFPAGREWRLASADFSRLLDGAWSHRAVWLGIFAMLLFFVGGSGVWAFEERIAASYGLADEWVGGVLGLSLLFAVIGPLISGGVGNRFGNRMPFTIACVFTILGILALGAAEHQQWLYAAGACSFMFGWGGGMPFIYSKVALEDPDGRHLALTIPAIGVGSMIGPAIAGSFYGDGSILVLEWISVLTVGISALMIWFAHTEKAPA